MRELEKPNFIRKNKLVRTTTFTVSLLIVSILLCSSVIPAVQVNKTNEIITKANDLQQSNPNPQLAIDLKTADRTIGTYPKKLAKINTGGNDNFMDLWDNGLPDGENGLSCMYWSGYNREIVDDFVADAPWIVNDGHFSMVTYYGYGPEAVSCVNIKFFEDAGGAPSTTLIASYQDCAPNAYLTGDYYFGRPEVAIDVAFGPLMLTPGTYWVEFQCVSTDNIFWLTSAGYGSQVYVSYPDSGYPMWTPGYTLWGEYYYGVTFRLTGVPADVEHDVGVTSIISPVSGGAGEAFTPKVKVANNGIQTEYDVPVHMTIDRWEPGIPSTYYMNEGFSSWMPTGWSQDGSWTQSWSSYAGGTSPEAYLPYYNIYYSYAYLASNAVNTNAATSLHLSFRSFIDDWSGGYTCKVWVYDGSAWQDKTPWTNPVYGNQGPALYDIDITTIKSASTQVMFEFSGTAWNLDYWYIDNVQLYQPGVPGYYVNEYDEYEYVDIPVGGKLDVIFTPDWEPEGWQVSEGVDIEYHIDARTEMIDDEIPSDDFKISDITLNYPFLHDIAVISINSPTEDGPAKTLPVSCTIKNVGQNEECCYQTKMVIGQQQVLGTPLSQDFSSGLMPPTCWYDEHKAVAYYYGWYISYSQQSGGTSPEAYLPYYYALAGYKFYNTCTFDTSMYAGAVLEFKSYINHFSGEGLYTLKAAISTNYGPWQEVWSFAPAVSQKFFVSVPITSGTNQRVALYFEGDPWYFNYWYVDDIEVKAVAVIEEYSKTFCTIELAPGEEADLEFDDWTPADLALGVSGEIDYIVVAEQMLPTDTNPANDKMSDGFTLDYWHDVKVKDITSPSMGRGDVIFTQRPYTPSESWSFYTTDSNAGYICQDDFWDLTDTIGDVHWYGLPLIYAYGWQQGDPTGMKFTIKFYEDSGGVPGAEAASYPDLEPTGINTGISYSGYIMYYWEVDLPSSVPLVNGWLSIQSTYCPDGSWLLWAGGPEGNFNALQNGGSLGDNLAFNLTKGGPPGPVKPEVWIPLNSVEAIAGIVQNAGTFVENGLTCYAEIYEYITNESGVQVYSDSISNIDLDNPLGGEETVNFDNYKFELQGVYNLIFNIPLIPPELDDKPANNLMKLGIGCDDTKPTTTYTLNPVTPNGLNGWYVSDLTITLDAKDGTEAWQSGVKEIAYKVGGGAVKTIPGGHGSFKIEDDGEDISVEYWAVDKVGNEETHHFIPGGIDMDQTKPTISMTYEVTGGNAITGWVFLFTVTATDETSGMESVEYYLNALIQETVNGSGPTYTWEVELGTIPNIVIKAIAYDFAGNNAYDEIDNPVSHSNEQSTPSSSTQTTKTVKINLGR